MKNACLTQSSVSLGNMLQIILIGTGESVTDLGGYLEQIGHQCLRLQECGPCLQLAQQALPNVVIAVAERPSESLLAELTALNLRAPVPVVLFVESCPEEAYQRVAEAQVCAFIVNGLEHQRLPSIMATAIARFQQTQALKAALAEARGQLEDRKQIDRAKAILIKARNFSENEAYHTLRKLAMDRNITIGEMAKNVIAMADLLK